MGVMLTQSAREFKNLQLFGLMVYRRTVNGRSSFRSSALPRATNLGAVIRVVAFLVVFVKSKLWLELKLTALLLNLEVSFVR